MNAADVTGDMGRDPPWSLERDPSCGFLLSTLRDRIETAPSDAVIGVSQDLQVDLIGPMLTIRHGDLQVHLPVIDGWPLRRLSTSAVCRTLADLADACMSDGDHESAILPYVEAALAIALAEDAMPPQVDASCGSYTVDFCMEGDTDRPALYVATGLYGEIDHVALPLPEGPCAPAPRIPCSMQEREPDGSGITSILMSFACSDCEGVTCDDVRIEPMDVLRIGAMRRPELQGVHDGSEDPS